MNNSYWIIPWMLTMQNANSNSGSVDVSGTTLAIIGGVLAIGVAFVVWWVCRY